MLRGWGSAGWPCGFLPSSGISKDSELPHLGPEHALDCHGNLWEAAPPSRQGQRLCKDGELTLALPSVDRVLYTFASSLLSKDPVGCDLNTSGPMAISIVILSQIGIETSSIVSLLAGRFSSDRKSTRLNSSH